jgi:hypothetical protein
VNDGEGQNERDDKPEDDERDATAELKQPAAGGSPTTLSI